MSRVVSHVIAGKMAAALFEAAGAPQAEAALVARELVTSSLMGHDSHGVLRVPDYLDLVMQGKIVPGAATQVERTSPTTAMIDGGWNFGAVCASQAVETAVDMARGMRTACVVTRRCQHVGRLGAWVQAIADEGLLGIATCNSPIHGHFVVPFGGKEGRLATNPIAYAVPRRGDPIVADFSTSVAPEGKVRAYRNLGRVLPAGWIVDAAGRPSTNPADFYGPPQGWLLPLGGEAGHKGFALSMLVEILGSALAGRSTIDPKVAGNGLWLLAVDPSVFTPLEQFRDHVEELVRYVKTSPGVREGGEVLVPGELEFRSLIRRKAEGIVIDDVTWQALHDHARRLGVDLAAIH